jgi:cytochrome P450
MPLPSRADRVSNVLALREAPLAFFARMAAEGDVVAAAAGHERFVLVSDPALARGVLMREEHSRQHNLEVPLIRRFLGDGALTSDGAAWALARRASGPPLAPRAVEELRDLIARITDDRLDALEAGPRAIFPQMAALTVRVTVEGLLGLPLTDAEASALATEVLFAQAHLFWWLGVPFGVIPPLPTRAGRRFRSAVGGLRALVDAVLAAPPRTRFVRHLDTLRDPDGRPLDTRQRRDQLMTMLVAAPENTATTLTWTLHLLSTHPDVQDRLRDEGATSPLWSSVISEALRLYPGAPYLDRRVVKEEELGGVPVRPGDILMVAPFLLHRDARFWEAPLAFRPSRFEGGDPPDAYMPFGHGPRRCVGEHLAHAILGVALPRLIARFSVLPVAGYVPDIDPVINLRPREGMPLLLHAIGAGGALASA